MRIAKYFVEEEEFTSNVNKANIIFHIKTYSTPFTEKQKVVIIANADRVVRDIKRYWKDIEDWNASMGAPY